MSQKRISQVPSESLTGANIDIQNEFLGQKACRIDPCTLDEASAIRSTGSRSYGHAYVGEPAIEFQRYASYANFRVNLLYPVMGVDHYNILDGPSNGTEMLLFFDDVLSLENPNGSAVLERGDRMVMDNCGFHHGRFAEGMLRDMLEEFHWSSTVISAALLSSFQYVRVMFPPNEKFPLSLLKVCSGRNPNCCCSEINSSKCFHFRSYKKVLFNIKNTRPFPAKCLGVNSGE